MILVEVKAIKSYDDITFEFQTIEDALPFMTAAMDAAVEDVKISIMKKKEEEEEDGDTV